MRDILITYKNRSSDRQNIYKIQNLNGKYNPVQTGKFLLQNIDNKFKLDISHDNIEGLSNFVVNFNLPEIKGYGTIGYNENFAFGLIKNVSIILDKKVVYSANGNDLLNMFNKNEKQYSKDIYNKLMLNIPNWLNYRKGNGSDFVIYPSQSVSVPLAFFFDSNLPFSILRNPKGSVISFELELNPIKSVINYNSEFKEKSLDNIVENYNPYLNVCTYNTISETISDRYIEQPQETVFPVIISGNSTNTYTTPKFKSITNLSYYIKSNVFNTGKSFVSYPIINNNEENIINTYEKAILKDILVVAKDQTFLNDYPNESEFLDITNVTTIKFNQFNNCNIDIIGIPSDHKLYYHKNILTFNRRNYEKVYNISEKFKNIRGIYYPKTHIIDFTFVESTIEMKDVSLPIDFWTHEYNTAFGDLRSKEAKKNDIYLNNPFIFGLDFIGKNNGIDSITISDNNNILVDSNDKIVVPDLSILNKNSNYITRFGVIFNNNDINFIEPSRLIAKPNENFDKCLISIDFIKYLENDIRNIFDYNLHLIITHVKKLTYDKNIINIVDQ